MVAEQTIVKTLKVGLELPHVVKTLRMEDMQAFSDHGVASIHTSDEVARKRGLNRAAAQGLQSCGYLMEVLVGVFGKAWFQGGKVNVAYVHPTYRGDVVTTRIRVAELRRVPGGTAVTLDLGCSKVDDKGETVPTVIGTATVVVPD